MKRERMVVFDYDDTPRTIELPDKDIALVHVTILSGDETGYVQFDDKTIMEFDASDCRMQNFYDGSYTITGEEDLEKWFDWEPEGEMLSYKRKVAMSR